MNLKVHPCRSLRGEISVPGDKSISHRALMLAAIAQGTSQIHGWLPAADCHATLNAVRALGVQVEQQTPTQLVVHGRGLLGLKPPEAGAALDCQGSGTTMRLVAGILAGQPFVTVLDGHAGLRRRPMERIAVPLRQMGAQILTNEGCPPVEIHGGQLSSIDYQMPVASAQVKSAVLLAGLYAEGETVIHQPGPARDHTERMLAAQGVALSQDGDVIRITPPAQPLTPFTMTVPTDFSSAAFPLVAALLVPGGPLLIKGVGINATRTGLLDVLRDMGAQISESGASDQGGEPVADLMVQPSPLRGAVVGGDMVVRMIDEFPILAVAATQARGETVVRDARELRMKESDRIAAVASELQKMGTAIEEEEDGFRLRGPVRLRGARVNSHGDHRLAMALVVAGLVADGATVVEGTEVIDDSFPGFVDMLTQAGADIELSA